MVWPVDPNCIFCQIVAGAAPASVVYKDETVIAFMDIHPVNPGHLLVVPVAHAAALADLTAQDGRAMFAVGQRLAAAVRRSGVVCEGVNLFLADGAAAGQDVFHTHLHIVPRYRDDNLRLSGFARVQFQAAPPRGELDAAAAAIRAVLDAAGG